MNTLNFAIFNFSNLIKCVRFLGRWGTASMSDTTGVSAWTVSKFNSHGVLQNLWIFRSFREPVKFFLGAFLGRCSPLKWFVFFIFYPLKILTHACGAQILGFSLDLPLKSCHNSITLKHQKHLNNIFLRAQYNLCPFWPERHSFNLVSEWHLNTGPVFRW